MNVLMLCARHNALDGRVFDLAAKTLVNAGHRVTIVAPRTDPAQRLSEKVDGVDIVRFDKLKNRFFRKFATLRSLFRLGRSLPADVIHVHEVDAALVAGARLKKYHRRRGRAVKLLFDSHEVWPWFYAAFRKRVLWRRIWVHFVMEYEHHMVSRHVAAIVTAHGMELEYYKWLNPWRPVRLVPTSPPVHQWPAPPERDRPLRVIGHQGFFMLSRGMDIILHSFETLAREYPDLKLLIAGDFRYDRDRMWYRDWCERTGLEERVATTGWIGQDELPPLLDRMDIGILAQRLDPHSARVFPANKLLNYWARALPVVSTTVMPYARREFERIGGGLVCDTYSADALTAQLRWMLQHPEECRSMGAKGYRHVKSVYSQEKSGEELLKAYADLERPPVEETPGITL